MENRLDKGHQLGPGGKFGACPQIYENFKGGVFIKEKTAKRDYYERNISIKERTGEEGRTTATMLGEDF